MRDLSSKKPQLFLDAENFFLMHLFYRFNKCFVGKKSQNSSLILKKAGSLIVLICFAVNVSSTDPQFSQNMFNTQAVNPGFAGSSGMVNTVFINRHQWHGVEGAPITTVFGADAEINPFGLQSGIGINFMNDQLGYFIDNSFTLSYSLRYELVNGSIGVGASFGYFNHVLDPSKGWIFNDGISEDPIVLESKVSSYTFDYGIGAFYKNDDYYIGLSISHLFNQELDADDNYFYYLRRTYYVTGGYKFPLRDKPIVLEPSIFIKTDGVVMQADYNINGTYKKRYWGGLSYRMQDAFIVLGGIELKSGLKVGVSYDIGLSKVANGSGGSIEVMLGYTFDLSFEKKTKHYKSVRYL
ncbi:MAG: type IX secretion system membrane protein PorP/SprF [Marinilabiliaceae bacterium]|nr:type IX secretion system membrane protein PorP/SprF [Marinilabiliaceae bacterium]